MTAHDVAIQALLIDGAPVRANKDGMLSLTDLFQMAQAAGMAEGKRDPRRWKDEAGSELIEIVAQTLNVPITDIIKGTRGKGGSTFAHPNVALAYAKYLSPELHMQVNEVYLRAKTGDVSLAEEIFDKASPLDQEKHARRVAGKVVRNQLTSSLAAHGVHGKGFADCTNAIYVPMLGAKASEVREKRGLKAGANVRDSMSIEELTRTTLAEIIAKKNIEEKRMRGNDPCAAECNRAGIAVSKVK